MIVTGFALLALDGTKGAHADGSTSPNDALYLSSPCTGTVDPVACADEDVLKYSPERSGEGSMHFDGSAANEEMFAWIPIAGAALVTVFDRTAECGIPAAKNLMNLSIEGMIGVSYNFLSVAKAVTICGVNLELYDIV